MTELLVLGGPLMVPILLASVVALAVFLARGWTLRPERVRPSALVDAVNAALRDSRPDRALEHCREHDAPLARVLAAGLTHAGAPRAERKERMEEVGQREVAQLERYVGIVGVVASIEPLLGLLGTVIGMIGVFQGVVSDGVGDPATLASGIWGALITTAAGLSTGIPAFIAWRILAGLVDRRAEDLERHALAVLDRMEASPVAEAP